MKSARPVDDVAFYEFCTNGEIVILPLPGAETSVRNMDLSTQLNNWSKRDGRGRAFDSNAEFILPDGTAYGPDASWVRNDRLATLTREQKRKFIPLCPDFVVELTSPSDRLSKVQAKMRVWIANGAELGWLIDADLRTVHIYRPGKDTEQSVGADHIDGEGPVAGFRLDLMEIWQGL